MEARPELDVTLGVSVEVDGQGVGDCVGVEVGHAQHEVQLVAGVDRVCAKVEVGPREPCDSRYGGLEAQQLFDRLRCQAGVVHDPLAVFGVSSEPGRKA